MTDAGLSGTRAVDASDFPWKGDPDSAACNFALGHLVSNLPPRLTINGRVHAETYIAAVGAIAGFAAQCTLFDSLVPELGVNMSLATAKSGQRYWFGDELNYMLVPRTDAEAATRVWGVAAGAAVSAGLPVAGLPDVGRMFAHVAATVGAESEGCPSVATKHHPHLPARELLKVVWPLALTCFSGKFPGKEQEYGVAPRRWWSAIAARASGRPIVDVKAVLAPDIALTILMETAIFASKLDLRTTTPTRA